jgi:KaiC/GvpD/RAD55 family RecA-like ATPase
MNRRELLQVTLGSALTTQQHSSGAAVEQTPIRTGLEQFDNLTGGLPPGSLTTFCGHYQGGRTTMAMNVAEYVAIEGKRPVLYLVQKFSAATLFGQIASSRAAVDWLDVAEGKLSAEGFGWFQIASRDLAVSALQIDDTPELDDAEVVERIERWSREHPGGLAIVDHINRGSNREIARCSQVLKAVAVRTGAAIVAAWQAPDDTGRQVQGVGLSHADFAWYFFRGWRTCSDLHLRHEVILSVFDERTTEERLVLYLWFHERLRRFHLVAEKPPGVSLRKKRLGRPADLVCYRILKPEEEAPPGARVVFMRESDLEAAIAKWNSRPGEL